MECLRGVSQGCMARFRYHGRTLHEDQTGRVWFLAGTFGNGDVDPRLRRQYLAILLVLRRSALWIREDNRGISPTRLSHLAQYTHFSILLEGP